MGDMRRSRCGVGCAWSDAEGRAGLAMRSRVLHVGLRGGNGGRRLVGSYLAECGVARDVGGSVAQARLPRSGTALVTRAGSCVAPRRGRAPLGRALLRLNSQVRYRIFRLSYSTAERTYTPL